VVQVARLKQGATLQAASSSATQHAQAAAGTPGTSAARGFTHNQLICKTRLQPSEGSE